MPASSVDLDEIARFADADQDWWNPKGAWGPLHKLNPSRIAFICEMLDNYFGEANQKKAGLAKLSVLDVGCGGGLACEPLARLGAKVTGLDVSEEALKIARAHAAQECLKIKYIHSTVEAFALGRRAFDVVLALEVLEHVASIDAFLQNVSKLLKPGGVLIASTVNRTTKSYLLGIVMAEYVLGWVPAGMHDWNKFVRPSELAEHLERAGMKLTDLTGIAFNPISGEFSLRQGRVDVNYIAAAVKS
ncbi:MAG: bifunctional 2-polyprenyl-6-hydroxyphenol methylase/3-demethylubiquinol 3-O-methyltransferase UbiG [Alphaproteobacteria bacterium]|nr:bifunctional 2-polyprenyl-6-hydroxyphenol methylase/3-demethylubiquinol 3-O-methyltransferase UbiG [Alphaproteobacteria bacterium]